MTRSFALTLIAVGLGAGIASAQPPFTVYGTTAPTARISYSDINLASAHGVATFQSRVRGAASDICLEAAREDLAMSAARTVCYRTAVKDGFSQIDQLVAEKLAGKASLSSAILISAR